MTGTDLPGPRGPLSAEEAVERIRRVPDRYRRFTVTEADAARTFGMTNEIRRRVLDADMPHEGSLGHRRFDQRDVENLGLCMHLRCPTRTAMRWWSRSLPGRGESAMVRYRIALDATCPTGQPVDQGCGAGCDFELDPAVADAPGLERLTDTGPGRYEIELALSRAEYYFDGACLGLFRRTFAFEFHILPHELNRDTGFLADAGLADCRLATQFIVEAADAEALEVRPAGGLFLAAPYPVEHTWVEVRIGGGWRTADPFMLSAFARWGVVDPAEWPFNRSPQGAYWRMGQYITRAVHHHGMAAPYAFRLLSKSS